MVFGAVAAAVALAVACGGGGGTTPACNNGDTRQCVGAGGCAGGQSCSGGAWSACDCGGTNDGGLDGNAVNDGGTSDGGPDITPYLKNCPQVAGTAPMVEIPAQGGGSFCIDTREVTANELNAVRPPKSIILKNSWPAIPECSSGTAPPLVFCTDLNRNTGELPADCVTFCDAAAYCTKAGKRMCASAELASSCFEAGKDFPWTQDQDAMVAECFKSPEGPASSSNCYPLTAPTKFVKDLVGGVREYTAKPNEWSKFPPPTAGPFVTGTKVCGEVVGIPNFSLTEAERIGFRCCADRK